VAKKEIKRRNNVVVAFDDFEGDSLEASREDLRQLRAAGVID
jgi:hypothetical protein